MSLQYITKQEAEALAGIKLDGRKKYFMWQGVVSYEARFTVGCSGCSDGDYYSSSSVGCGCRECGYTGRRRGSYPVPANPKQYI